MPFVSGSHQNYKHWGLRVTSIRTLDRGVICNVKRVTVNLLMCDRGYVLYSVRTGYILIVSLNKPPSPLNGKYKYDVTYTSL